MISRLLQMLDESKCNFWAVEVVKRELLAKGFSELKEADEWKLEPGGCYFVEKNGTAIFALKVGKEDLRSAGARIISAHTDSPCFKLKPNCEIYGDGGVVSLNVEKYGGGIMYTWFDRPLSMAGRVSIANQEDPLHPITVILDFKQPIATIPHLAIHFNRAVNEGNPLSVQKDMKPVVGYFNPEQIEEFKRNGGVIRSKILEHINSGNCHVEDSMGQLISDRKITADDLIDYELSLYPCEPAGLVGLEHEYFQSARIDDLSMAFAGLEAMLDTADSECNSTGILALFDNEETGSATKQGAHSPVLRHILERICAVQNPGDAQAFHRAIAHSFMISADDAHGWHPNYNEKYDPTNHPVLGGGPVVKINANCKYMTDSDGASVFRQLCKKAGVGCQYFVNHADVAGGSTLGNISSVQLDIRGVDVGNAIWAMHSARETAAVSDHIDMVKVLTEFLK
ncbi:MAG: M18 family aminopeptidase [Muribaculaceae bacterium]|nr:M18 family aminopeptidase [Muribaculaceae bacterium]